MYKEVHGPPWKTGVFRFQSGGGIYGSNFARCSSKLLQFYFDFLEIVGILFDLIIMFYSNVQQRKLNIGMTTSCNMEIGDT